MLWKLYTFMFNMYLFMRDDILALTNTPELTLHSWQDVKIQEITWQIL